MRDQEERLFAGSVRACLKRRRACFSFSLQAKEFGLHKLKMANKRNTMIELEFLMIAEVEAEHRQGKARVILPTLMWEYLKGVWPHV